MKIAIPVDENNIDTNVCISFGRAPYFMIYDNESKEIEFIINTAADSQGGAGIKAAQIIADTKSEILLTPRCGMNAVEVLEGSKIKLYKTISHKAFENIKEFTEGKLSLLEDIHAGFHGHGGR